MRAWLRVTMQVWRARERARKRRQLGIPAFEQTMMDVLAAQNTALAGTQRRLDAVEELLAATAKVVGEHHAVIKRWATESATLRSIEEKAFNEQRRAKMRLVEQGKQIEQAMQEMGISPESACGSEEESGVEAPSEEAPSEEARQS